MKVLKYKSTTILRYNNTKVRNLLFYYSVGISSIFLMLKFKLMELWLQLVLKYERTYVRKYIPKYKGTKIRKYKSTNSKIVCIFWSFFDL